VDEAQPKLEEVEVIDEIGLDESQLPQVFQLLRPESQRAEVVQLRFDFLVQGGEVRWRIVAAMEAIFARSGRKAVQEGLQHRELVEVGIEEALDHGLERHR